MNDSSSNQMPIGIPPETGIGYLIVRVTTALGAIPLPNASVTVRKYNPDEPDTPDAVLYSVTTDRDGNSPRMSLPAPMMQKSFEPGGLSAYAPYNISVAYDGYYNQFYSNVPVFTGITAIQQADLVPLPANGRQDSRTPDGQKFYESQNPEL